MMTSGRLTLYNFVVFLVFILIITGYAESLRSAQHGHIETHGAGNPYPISTSQRQPGIQSDTNTNTINYDDQLPSTLEELRRHEEIHSRDRDKKSYKRNSRHAYPIPLIDSLLHHSPIHAIDTSLLHHPYRSPLAQPMHSYYRDELRLMDRIRNKMIHHIKAMSGHGPQKYQTVHRHQQRRHNIHGDYSQHRKKYGQPYASSGGFTSRIKDNSNPHEYDNHKYRFDRRQHIPEDIEILQQPSVFKDFGLRRFSPEIPSVHRYRSSHGTKHSKRQRHHQQGRSRKTTVEDILFNKSPPARDDVIPCIKCPEDTRVEAPKGSDCVVAHTPTPSFSCSSRMIPDLQTIVIEGPAGGTLLPEGHYQMIISILTSGESTSTPLTTCKVKYDVEVRKCPVLQEVEGADISCTTGNAWGSRCHWYCRGNLILIGSSVTTCTGHSQPRWSNPPPVCTDPPFERPETPQPPTIKPTLETIGCLPPKEILGGVLNCYPPSEEIHPPRKFIPKVKPFPKGVTPIDVSHSVEILPRRDFIPKDEPAFADFSRVDLETGYGTQQYLESSISSIYAIGTVCRIECNHGTILRESEQNTAAITCTQSLTWDKTPPICYPKESPTLLDGECEDMDLSSRLSHSQLKELPYPVFFTTDGELAEVNCDIEEVEPDIHYVRTCKASDPYSQTTAYCYHDIFTDVTGTDGTTDSPKISSPKHTDFATVGDVFNHRRKHYGTKKKVDETTKRRFKDEGISNWDSFASNGDVPDLDSLPYTFKEINKEFHPTMKDLKRATSERSGKQSYSHSIHDRGRMSKDVTKYFGKSDKAASIQLDILVEDCQTSDQILNAISGILLSQHGCHQLHCSVPQLTCQHNAGKDDGIVRVNWVVSETYGSTSETSSYEIQGHSFGEEIKALMVSSETVISSELTTRILEGLGAAVDLTSFNLNYLGYS